MKKWLMNLESSIVKFFEFFGFDGLLHMLMCLVIFILLVPFVGKFGALCFTSMIAILKGGYDVIIKDSYISKTDAVADVFGIVLGFLLVLYIQILM